MAILTTLGGAVGFVLGLIVQIPFTPHTLQSTVSVVAFLGIAGAISIFATGLTGGSHLGKAQTEPADLPRDLTEAYS